MRIPLPYGRSSLEIELPDTARIIAGRPAPPLPDPIKAIEDSLVNPIAGPPLRKLAGNSRRIVIVHTDITRATPNRLVIPLILEELRKTGVSSKYITLLNSTGTHRAQSIPELREMLGAEVVDEYEIIQHNAFDERGLAPAGRTSSGREILLNRRYLEADLRIVTGFIEPHVFAGFSGGPKAVLPGIAGIAAIMRNHRAENIDHERATWGVTQGNPIWEEMAEAARIAPPQFMLNVSLGKDKGLTGVFAGGLFEAHARGCAFVRESAMVPVDDSFDILVTTNSGYPLDQNLYQTVKGMCAASPIVKKGGAIVIASACSEGLPEGGAYAGLLSRYRSAAEFLPAIRSSMEVLPDQWQLQLQARVLERQEVYLYTDGLTEAQLKGAMLRWCGDIPRTIEELMKRYGRDARIGVMPEGPLVVPYLA